MRTWGHQCDVEVLFREQLCHHTSEVVVVVVEQHDALTTGPQAGQDGVGGQYVGPIGDLDRVRVPPADTIAAPM